MHTYIYTYIHTYIHTCILSLSLSHACIHTYIHAIPCIYAHMRAYIHAHMMHACIHAGELGLDAALRAWGVSAYPEVSSQRQPCSCMPHDLQTRRLTDTQHAANASLVPPCRTTYRYAYIHAYRHASEGICLMPPDFPVSLVGPLGNLEPLLRKQISEECVSGERISYPTSRDLVPLDGLDLT